MIWVGNSISMNAWTPDSDIDLFIITSPNKLWTVRILITLIFQILWVRKTSSKHAGRFCLSFFATENALDFSSFAIENDVYLYFRILYFKPILNFDNTYENFIEANATWADFSLYQDIIEENKKGVKIKNSNSNKNKISNVRNTTGLHSLPEKLLKKIFLSRTLKTYEKLRKPFWVIINDDMLKFHDKDVREKVRDEIIST
jgi:predicted nucleotidyltransferase